MKHIILRDLTPSEYHWLDKTVKAGTIVTEVDDLYGCCSESGTACLVPGIEGYCEIPTDALGTLKDIIDKTLN